MVAIKAHQAAAFLKSPDVKIAAVLFYGTDPGLVSERAQALASQMAARENPPSDIIRIAEQDLEQDPDRLIVELQTIPMFGGRQVVRANHGRRITAAALQPLIAGNKLGGYLVLEAGNLKPADGLRKLFEKSPQTAAVACFPDSSRDLDGMIQEVLNQSGLSITADAKAVLISRLGADRALSRGEVEKLALYVANKKTIEVADVDAIVGDASELAIDRIIMSAAAGNSAGALRECDRAISSGDSPQVIILFAGRHFQRLHRLRSALDAGRSLDDALRSLRPPIHFKQKDAFARQVRGWSASRLTDALARISVIAQQARRNANLETVLTERLLLELARLARAGRQG